MEAIHFLCIWGSASYSLMKAINFKSIHQYLYDQLTGSFMGFMIGASATGLVSQFFETRSMKNLWGLTSKKTVVDKETFHELEWIISIVIGFVVFEIVTKFLKEKLPIFIPRYKKMLFRWLIREKLHERLRTVSVTINRNQTVFFAAIHHGVKQAFDRFSKKP